MSPQYLLFKVQDSVPGGDMEHGTAFQPFGGCIQHCKHMALVFFGLWECGIINLPGFHTFVFQPSSSTPPSIASGGKEGYQE